MELVVTCLKFSLRDSQIIQYPSDFELGKTVRSKIFKKYEIIFPTILS